MPSIRSRTAQSIQSHDNGAIWALFVLNGPYWAGLGSFLGTGPSPESHIQILLLAHELPCPGGPAGAPTEGLQHRGGGPEDHINTRISHSGSRAQSKGMPEIMVCRILMFMWSVGSLNTGVLSFLVQGPQVVEGVVQVMGTFADHSDGI